MRERAVVCERAVFSERAHSRREAAAPVALRRRRRARDARLPSAPLTRVARLPRPTLLVVCGRAAHALPREATAHPRLVPPLRQRRAHAAPCPRTLCARGDAACTTLLP
jgi:hypothetical protein